MKKIFLLIVFGFGLLLVKTATAQRYIGGMSATQLQFGISAGGGITAGAGLSQYTKGKNRLLIDVEYLQDNFTYTEKIKIPLSQFTASGGFYKMFYSDPTKTFFMAFGISVMFGYETINWGTTTLSDGAKLQNSDQFLYGGALTFEAEYYFTDKYIGIFGVRQRILGGSTVDVGKTTLSIGLKIILEKDENKH